MPQTFIFAAMNLKFCGAARQVTGSMHLLTTESGYQLLIDCGVDYELQKSFTNYEHFRFPFDPASINAVILTHAHVDHSGNLPYLIKNGYEGQIICTEATAALTRLLLRDSFHIMEEEWQKKYGRLKKKKKPELPYSLSHIKAVGESMVTLSYGKPFKINDELEVTLQQAGHILGASSPSIRVQEKERELLVGFTGDLGNYHSKLMVDPAPFKDHTVIISESTYGGRHHSGEHGEEELLKYITETCVEEKGRLIIPAFSVGRSHAIAFTCAQLYVQGKLPAGIPIYIDSPLAYASAGLYQNYIRELNDEAKQFFAAHGDLFELGPIEFVDSNERSDLLSYSHEPCVVISAAGMVEGGRIQKHIRENISNPKITILIAGFCAPGTLGYRLLQGQSTISIQYKEYPVYARIAKTDAFSAHPDHDGLLSFFNACKSPKLENIFLVHGEELSMSLLGKSLKESFNCKVLLPYKNESFDL